MERAFYEPGTEHSGTGSFVATVATAGPWSPDAQHGGPPSALAARALELHEPDERQRLVRVAIDILRPVPVGKISLRARTLRPGRRITLVEAIMEADGQEVLHARGWRIERPASPMPEIADGEPRPGPVPPPGDSDRPLIFQRHPEGYLASIDWRFLPEPAAGTVGSRAAWTRPMIPLLPDEQPSPMSRALLVADSGSGVSAALPPADFIFINVDLTVALSRDPIGDWLLLEASTSIGAEGTGLALTRLADQSGSFGHGLQTLLVAPR